MGQCLIEVWIVDGRRVAILREGLLLELQLASGVRGVGQVDKLLAARSALLWWTKPEGEVVEGLGVVEVEVVNVVSKCPSGNRRQGKQLAMNGELCEESNDTVRNT